MLGQPGALLAAVEARDMHGIGDQGGRGAHYNFFSTAPGLWVSHGAAALASLASRVVAPLHVGYGYPWQAAVTETCGLVDRSDRQADATGDGSILAHRASSANFWLEHVVPSRFSLVQPHRFTLTEAAGSLFFFFSLGS